MDVPDQLQQVAFALDQERLEASLKEVAGPFFAPVDPAGIAKRKILHAARQWNVAGLE